MPTPRRLIENDFRDADDTVPWPGGCARQSAETCAGDERLTAMRLMVSNLDESLLRREGRAGLPFGRLLRLYLDPGALFKDASCGSLLAREQARRYNVRHRWMLLAYVRRWMTIAVFFFASVGAAEALGAQIVYSEDLRHKQKYRTVRIENPFH